MLLIAASAVAYVAELHRPGYTNEQFTTMKQAVQALDLAQSALAEVAAGDQSTESGAEPNRPVESTEPVAPEIRGSGSAATEPLAPLLTEELERLAALRADGLLSDEEFTTAKARLLGR